MQKEKIIEFNVKSLALLTKHNKKGNKKGKRLKEEYVARPLTRRGSGPQSPQTMLHTKTVGSKNINDDMTAQGLQQQEIPQASIVLILSEKGKVLAVSRLNDKTDFSLPGGKVDSGETAHDAAIRELGEETGLRAKNLNPIYSAPCDSGYYVTTFAGKVAGDIHSDEDAIIKWLTPEQLLQGSFSDYNRKLFNFLNL